MLSVDGLSLEAGGLQLGGDVVNVVTADRCRRRVSAWTAIQELDIQPRP
jgi:hypothetical protein